MQDVQPGHPHLAFSRIIVAGTSCAGKTTFARRLAAATGAHHVELDALHWSQDWLPKPPEEFRKLTLAAIKQDRWIIDGNYGVVRDVVWPSAELVCWLNYSFVCVFGRALKRTLWRVFTRQRVFAGNQESFRRAFLSRDSILWWVITTFQRRRREFTARRTGNEFPHLRWIEFRSPAEAEAFLRELELTRHHDA